MSGNNNNNNSMSISDLTPLVAAALRDRVMADLHAENTRLQAENTRLNEQLAAQTAIIERVRTVAES